MSAELRGRLAATVKQRDALRAQLEEEREERAGTERVLAAVTAERDALRTRAEVAEGKIELGRAFSAHARACNDANRCGDKASHDRAMATKQRLADARSRLKALGVKEPA
jgi:uncharacterized protein (DUF3084 family)